MNEAEDLRNEALRLLRSVDSLPLADAMDVQRRAGRLLGLADRIDQGARIMSKQPTHRQVLNPKFCAGR
jgi:hypothetical protein